MLEEGSFALGLLQHRWPDFSEAKGFSLGLFLVKLVPAQPAPWRAQGNGKWHETDGSWGVRGPSRILGAELPMGLFTCSITRGRDLGESYKVTCLTGNVTAFPLPPLSPLKWGHVNPGDAHATFL